MRILTLALLAACSGGESGDSGGDGPGTTSEPVTGYEVRYSWTPEGCPAPGETIEFTTSIVDQLGRPIPDLQQSHERMVHTLFVSQDLESFQHVHQEDFEEITADDLRASTFRFPVSFPAGGGYRVVTDFAHLNFYQAAQGWIDVCGEPSLKPEPEPDFATEVDVDGLHVALTWVEAPVVDFLAQWTVTITEADGTDVTDLVQWLGADAHVALISGDLASTTHSHAWTPGIDNMSPGMEMPHVYTGPEVSFQSSFAQPGLHRMFVQFAREGAPETPYTAPFWFEVSE